MKYIIYHGKDGYRWHLIGGNGEVMAQGEAHPSVKLARAAIRRVKRSMLAPVIIN